MPLNSFSVLSPVHPLIEMKPNLEAFDATSPVSIPHFFNLLMHASIEQRLRWSAEILGMYAQFYESRVGVVSQRTIAALCAFRTLSSPLASAVVDTSVHIRDLRVPVKLLRQFEETDDSLAMQTKREAQRDSAARFTEYAYWVSQQEVLIKALYRRCVENAEDDLAAAIAYFETAQKKETHSAAVSAALSQLKAFQAVYDTALQRVCAHKTFYSFISPHYYSRFDAKELVEKNHHMQEWMQHARQAMQDIHEFRAFSLARSIQNGWRHLKNAANWVFRSPTRHAMIPRLTQEQHDQAAQALQREQFLCATQRLALLTSMLTRITNLTRSGLFYDDPEAFMHHQLQAIDPVLDAQEGRLADDKTGRECLSHEDLIKFKKAAQEFCVDKSLKEFPELLKKGKALLRVLQDSPVWKVPSDLESYKKALTAEPFFLFMCHACKDHSTVTEFITQESALNDVRLDSTYAQEFNKRRVIFTRGMEGYDRLSSTLRKRSVIQDKFCKPFQKYFVSMDERIKKSLCGMQASLQAELALVMRGEKGAADLQNYHEELSYLRTQYEDPELAALMTRFNALNPALDLKFSVAKGQLDFKHIALRAARDLLFTSHLSAAELVRLEDYVVQLDIGNSEYYALRNVIDMVRGHATTQQMTHLKEDVSELFPGTCAEQQKFLFETYVQPQLNFTQQPHSPPTVFYAAAMELDPQNTQRHISLHRELFKRQYAELLSYFHKLSTQAHALPGLLEYMSVVMPEDLYRHVPMAESASMAENFSRALNASAELDDSFKSLLVCLYRFSNRSTSVISVDDVPEEFIELLKTPAHVRHYLKLMRLFNSTYSEVDQQELLNDLHAMAFFQRILAAQFPNDPVLLHYDEMVSYFHKTILAMLTQPAHNQSALRTLANKLLVSFASTVDQENIKVYLAHSLDLLDDVAWMKRVCMEHADIGVFLKAELEAKAPLLADQQINVKLLSACQTLGFQEVLITKVNALIVAYFKGELAQDALSQLAALDLSIFGEDYACLFAFDTSALKAAFDHMVSHKYFLVAGHLNQDIIQFMIGNESACAALLQELHEVVLRESVATKNADLLMDYLEATYALSSKKSLSKSVSTVFFSALQDKSTIFSLRFSHALLHAVFSYGDEKLRLQYLIAFINRLSQLNSLTRCLDFLNMLQPYLFRNYKIAIDLSSACKESALYQEALICFIKKLSTFLTPDSPPLADFSVYIQVIPASLNSEAAIYWDTYRCLRMVYTVAEMTLEPEFFTKEKYGIALEFFIQQLQAALKNETFLLKLTSNKINFLHHILFEVKEEYAVAEELAVLSSLKAGLDTFYEVQAELEGGALNPNPHSLSAHFYEHLASPHLLAHVARSLEICLRYLVNYLQEQYDAIIQAPEPAVALQERSALLGARLFTQMIAVNAEQSERAALHAQVQAFKALVHQEELCRHTLSDEAHMDSSKLTLEGIAYFWLPALRKMLADKPKLSWSAVDVIEQLITPLEEGDTRRMLMHIQAEMETYLRASNIKPKATLAQAVAELGSTLKELEDADADAYLKQLAEKFREPSVSAADRAALFALKQAYYAELTQMPLYRGQKNERRFKQHVMFAQHFFIESERQQIVASMLLQTREFHEKFDALIYLAEYLGSPLQQKQVLSLQAQTEGGRLAHELNSVISYVKHELQTYLETVKEEQIKLQLGLVLDKLNELQVIYNFVNDTAQQVGFSERCALNKTILDALLKLSASASNLIEQSQLKSKSYAELLAKVSTPLFRVARVVTPTHSVATSSVSTRSEDSGDDSSEDDRASLQSAHSLRVGNEAVRAVAPIFAFWQVPKEGPAVNPLLDPYQRLCENAGVEAIIPAKKRWIF